jgi:hypothetical protein
MCRHFSKEMAGWRRSGVHLRDRPSHNRTPGGGPPATDGVLRGAETLVVTQRLRGYDAVHPASAALWQELLDEPVTLAIFDRELWNAAADAGVDVWPAAISPLS